MVKTPPAKAGDIRDVGLIDPCVRKIPWRRAWQPTPVFLPGESHGQRSLVGNSPWDHKESDTTEAIQHTLTAADCRHESHSGAPKLSSCIAETLYPLVWFFPF